MNEQTAPLPSGGAIDRRQFLRLAALAGLVAQTGLGADPSAGPAAHSAKKGLGLTTKAAGWAAKLEALRVRWVYTWGAARPDATPAGVEFVPMIWGYKSKERLQEEIAHARQAGAGRVLCFNEPDGEKQANLTVDAVLAAWPELLESGLALGSPGCVHPDNKWMTEFMARADALRHRVDFVSVHSYGGPNVAALVKKLTETHERYGRPLWITEFAVGDWKAKTADENRHRPADVLAFMKECLPALDELKFLERYAWFPAATTSAPLGPSALFNPDGSLTPLGECYAAH
jgi:Glycosyl hydrolase catalytic core